mmetsp:Transcript_26716/g.39516  ORF Transcript_26716/g.39516 Transcript_26716/m.39516 type:complete len:203 (-) Transcript_26716:327-935(-)
MVNLQLAFSKLDFNSSGPMAATAVLNPVPASPFRLRSSTDAATVTEQSDVKPKPGSYLLFIDTSTVVSPLADCTVASHLEIPFSLNPFNKFIIDFSFMLRNRSLLFMNLETEQMRPGKKARDTNNGMPRQATSKPPPKINPVSIKPKGKKKKAIGSVHRAGITGRPIIGAKIIAAIEVAKMAKLPPSPNGMDWRSPYVKPWP